MSDQIPDEYYLEIQVVEVTEKIGDYRRHIPNILREAAGYIERKEPMPDFLAAYISKTLLSVANGEDANVAIGLKSKRGNKDERKHYYRDLDIYFRIREYHQQGYRLEIKHKGINACTKAHGDISEKNKRSIDRLEAIYHKIDTIIKEAREKSIKEAIVQGKKVFTDLKSFKEYREKKRAQQDE